MVKTLVCNSLSKVSSVKLSRLARCEIVCRRFKHITVPKQSRQAFCGYRAAGFCAKQNTVIFQARFTAKFKDYFISISPRTISTLITGTKGWIEANSDGHKSVHLVTNESAPTNLLNLECRSFVLTGSPSQGCVGSCLRLFQTRRPSFSMAN